jgi:1-acyl-sn-glycerol-3-phosphate acyltransferase
MAANAPAVWMVRHQSNLDVVTLGGIYPPRTVVIGKKQIAKIPVFGWFYRATGNVLLDRGDLSRAIASIRAAAERVRRERISVWVFPEGHRNQGAKLLPFKKGVFHLAVEAQVPIVPIVTEPMNTIIDGHRWMARPGRFRVRVLPPIPTAGLTGEDVEPLMETVRARMQEAQDELAETSRAPIAPRPCPEPDPPSAAAPG